MVDARGRGRRRVPQAGVVIIVIQNVSECVTDEELY